jgi:RNA polymerase sigma-70 factor, ECF subfamily
VPEIALNTDTLPRSDDRSGDHHDRSLLPARRMPPGTVEFKPTEPQAATSGLDDAASIFESVRPRLFGIAYRMLGSSTEAEDIMQDVWLRWQAYDRSAVVNATAFLVTTTTRLAINVAKSARSRRETCVGMWHPDPVDTSADPELRAERGEALALGVLLLLERLSPTERAAYVLREAFDYPYPQIANVLQLKEVNARQLVSRARKHIAGDRRESVSSAEQRHLLSAFVAAAQLGDFAALEELFAA